MTYKCSFINVIRVFCSCFILLLNSNKVFAQNDGGNFPKRNWKVFYCGNNIINPGISTSFEQVILESQKDKKALFNSSRTKHFTRRYFLDANLGGYWDPKSHVGVFHYYSIGTSKLSNSGFIKGWSLGPGIYRSFLPETYVYNNYGDITKKRFPGTFYFAPALSYHLGSFSNDERAFARFTALFLMPYNNALLPLINIELGFGI